MAESSRSRSIRPYLRRIAGVVVVIAIVVVLVFASMPQPVPVDVAEVRRGELEVTIHEDGRAQVKDRYTISAPITGQIARVELEPGDAIERGAPVAYVLPMSPSPLDARSRAEAEARLGASRANERRARSAIERAEAALELAEQEGARQQELQRSGASTERDRQRAQYELRSAREAVDSARFSARVASHEVRMAEAALGSLTGASGGEQFVIPSPVDGRVLRVLQRSEGVVQAGAPILEVGDPNHLEMVVDVLTTDAVSIAPGNPARIVHWGGEGSLGGRVRRKEPSAFTRMSALGVEEQRVNVILDFTDAEDRWSSLGDGYRVEAVIVVDRAEDVLQVPAGAVFRHGEGWALFRLEEGKARLTSIEIGRRADRTIEVRDGVSEGDRVVLHPSDRVAEGVDLAAR